MAWRVSYIWEQQAHKTFGWTENFWNSQSNIDAVRQAAVRLGGALRGMHGRRTILKAIRMQEQVVPPQQIGEGLNDLLRFQPTVNDAVAEGTDSDYPETAILLELLSGTGRITKQWLRGVWDGVLTISGVLTPTPGYATQIQAVERQLEGTSNGWSMRIKDRTILKRPIVSVTPLGVVTVTAHGYPDNQLVSITRTGMIRVDHLWRIRLLTNDTFFLLGWDALNGFRDYVPWGFAQGVVYDYVQVADSRMQVASGHVTGGPTDRPTGRRRVRL